MRFAQCGVLGALAELPRAPPGAMRSALFARARIRRRPPRARSRGVSRSSPARLNRFDAGTDKKAVTRRQGACGVEASAREQEERTPDGGCVTPTVTRSATPLRPG